MVYKKHTFLNIFISILLIINGLLLYTQWYSTLSYDEKYISQIILHATALELHYYNYDFIHELLQKSENHYSAHFFVRDEECRQCIIDAQSYLQKLLLNPIIDVFIYYYSARSSRDWERFAQWKGLPYESIIPVNNIETYDPLFWESSGPSTILLNNKTKNIELAHASFSELRERSIMIYEALHDRLDY